ncbi:MAG: HAMP domain-containing sensor histidine kinase [Kofleriaceae bacterium]
MRWFEATVGRRLLVRIWVHGLLLFAGVIVIVIIGRKVMSDFDARLVLRHNPHLAVAVTNGLLAQSTNAASLERELALIRKDVALDVAVFDGDHGLLATTVTPPLTSDEVPRGPEGRWFDDRLVLGKYREGQLVAYAVVALPPAPSVLRHVIALLGSALVLAFLFVAAPLAHSIARPLERLRGLASELGNGNLAVRARVDRHDEIGDLSRAFNTMAAQIQRLRATERELLGDVSHELRTPLARMRVVLDLAEGADPEKVRRYLDEITTDLAELEQLVDDIIVSARLDPESSRWEQARPPLRLEHVAIVEPVDASIARFSARWPAHELVYKPGDEALTVNCDPKLLRRVLDNLLDNARKYSAEGAPIEIRVDAVSSSVRVEVIDRGIGIAKEDQHRLFSAFFRADPSRARSSGGVGLGLVLARRIVEAHGGIIKFESEIDSGSRFWFELPLVLT